MKLLEQVHSDYQKLSQLVEQEIPNVLKKEHFTLEDYKWALATIWSRSFDVEIDGQQVRVLPPFADMFNHSITAVEKHLFDPNSRCLRCITYSSFAPGDQIFINYGPFPNHKLLRLYGFALQNNPHDHVELWCPMSPEAPLFDYKMSILQKKGISNHQCFYLQRGKLSSDLLATLRVQRLEPIEFANADQAFKNQPVSVENERLVLSSLLAALQDILQAYPDSLDSDEELFKNGSTRSKTRLHYALLLRISEKQILKNNMELLRKSLLTLENNSLPQQQ